MATNNPTEHRALELVSAVAANEAAFSSERSQITPLVSTTTSRGWDPYDVWRTRVKLPQDQRARRTED